MIIFSVAPKRIGMLDFLITFIHNFKHYNKKFIPIILFFDKELFLEFKKNIVLYKLLKLNGYYLLFNLPKIKILNRFLRLLILMPFLIFFLLKKNNMVLIYGSITSVIDKLLFLFNKCRGITYTYLANNTYNDLINRYFDSNDNPINRKNDKVTFLKKSNPGDALLVNSLKAKKFLRLKGYKKFKIIGFPFLNNPFQKFIKFNLFKILNEELNMNFSSKDKINSILINKFWGRWSNQNYSWLKKNLNEIINIINKQYPEGKILIRAYPFKNLGLEKILKKIKKPNIYISNMHPSSLSCISQNILSIAQSSVCLSCVAFEKPYFEISRINFEQKKLYRNGSIYSNYCWVFNNLTKFKKSFNRKKKIKISKKNFKKKIGHKEINFNNLIF